MKIKKQLSKLKYKAYELKTRGQMPLMMFKLICSFDDKTTEIEVKFLNELCSRLLRVRNYYFTHKDEEEEYNQIILKNYEQFKKENNLI